MEGRQQRACWTKGAPWQRGHQVGGGGEYTGVEAGAKTARAECPHWMGKGDTLAVSWGLQNCDREGRERGMDEFRIRCGEEQGR